MAGGIARCGDARDLIRADRVRFEVTAAISPCGSHIAAEFRERIDANNGHL